MSEVDEKNADTVIVERAERFLPEMAQSPPIMEGPECQVNVTEEDTVPAGAGAVQCETREIWKRSQVVLKKNIWI